MKKRGIWIALFLMPTIIIFLLVYAVPLITVVSTSLLEWKGIQNETKFIGIENYINLFLHDSDFSVAMLNTIVWVILQSTVHIALGVILALILRKKPFGWKFTRTAYLVPCFISMAVLALIFLDTFKPQTGLLNGIIRAVGFSDFSQNWYFDSSTAFLTVTFTWLAYAGIVTILAQAQIASIPSDIYEAAKVDGATNMQTDFFITLPMMKNIIASCVILAGTSMLKEFELIFLTTKGGPENYTLNLPLYLYKTATLENNYGYGNAIGSILVVLGIVIIVFVSKIFKYGESDI